MKPAVSQSDSPFIRETSGSIPTLRLGADQWEMQEMAGQIILQFPVVNSGV